MARPRRVRFRFPMALVLVLLFIVLVGVLAYCFPQWVMRPSRNAHGVTIASPFFGRVGLYRHPCGGSFSVYEDMTVPVFYDPADPSKNVTPCATYLRVATQPF
jgi:hypothetical protein